MTAILLITEALAVVVFFFAGLLAGHFINCGDWFGAGLMVVAIAAITHLIATEE